MLMIAGADVNLSDYKGQTPLSVCVNNAIVHSCRTAIQKLLTAGAIVDKLVLLFLKSFVCFFIPGV